MERGAWSLPGTSKSPQLLVRAEQSKATVAKGNFPIMTMADFAANELQSRKTKF